MKLTGDDTAIAALKEIAKTNKDYLKFLIGEARSNSDFQAPYEGPDGAKYMLKVDRATGNLIVGPR